MPMHTTLRRVGVGLQDARGTGEVRDILLQVAAKTT